MRWELELSPSMVLCNTSGIPTVELCRSGFLLVGEDGVGHRLPVLQVEQEVLAGDLDTGNAGLVHGGKGLLPLGHRTSGNHLLSELFEVSEVQIEPPTVERQSEPIERSQTFRPRCPAGPINRRTSPRSMPALAAPIDGKTPTVKGHVMKARQEGYLTDTTFGKEGGEPTQKALDLVNQG